MSNDSENENKTKFIKLLLRAAEEEAVASKLITDPEGTLKEAGITVEGFTLPTAIGLKTAFRILEALGVLLEKRY